jgi:hypothetical protein
MGVAGQGGMGTIYLAARADDLYRQNVAIKLERTASRRTKKHMDRTEATNRDSVQKILAKFTGNPKFVGHLPILALGCVAARGFLERIFAKKPR